LNTFVFALVALSLIFVIVDLMEKIDKFIDQNASLWIVAEYYIYFLPEIIKLMTPIAALLATLFSVGKFSTNNEITAMKSGGISLYQIMLPYVMMSLFISLGHLYFNGWIVPRAQTHKIALEQKYLNKISNSMNLVNVHFRDTPYRNILMGYYDTKGKYASNVAIETYTSEFKPRLKERFESEKIQWDSKNRKWIAHQALIRHYLPDGNVSMQRLDSTIVNLSLSHEQIVKLKMSTKEMTFPEFKDYINLLKKGGKDIRRQLIEYHGNYAFPFANLIVVLFGVPFASVRKKGGIAIQISAALVISFLYILFTKVSQTIGYYIDITPVLVGWIANILFLLSSLFVLWRTRT
jgi:lipopolysaccharide export system permease protein